MYFFALYMSLVIILDGPEHQESPPRPVSGQLSYRAVAVEIISESMHACIVHAPLCMVEAPSLRVGLRLKLEQ